MSRVGLVLLLSGFVTDCNQQRSPTRTAPPVASGQGSSSALVTDSAPPEQPLTSTDLATLLKPRKGTRPLALNLSADRVYEAKSELYSGSEPRAFAQAGSQALTDDGPPSVEDLSCTFGAVKQPASLLDAGPDDEPGLVTALRSAIPALVCGSGQGKCQSSFARNEAVVLTAFQKRMIQYGWSSVQDAATGMGIGTSGKYFATFMLGLLSHEYGHFLDLVSSRGNATADFCRLHLSLCGKYDRRKQRELFADSVCGCALVRSGLAEAEGAIAVLRTAFERFPPDDHPDFDDRTNAALIGWDQCDSTDVPSLELARRVLTNKSTAIESRDK